MKAIIQAHVSNIQQAFIGAEAAAAELPDAERDACLAALDKAHKFCWSVFEEFEAANPELAEEAGIAARSGPVEK